MFDTRQKSIATCKDAALGLNRKLNRISSAIKMRCLLDREKGAPRTKWIAECKRSKFPCHKRSKRIEAQVKPDTKDSWKKAVTKNDGYTYC